MTDQTMRALTAAAKAAGRAPSIHNTQPWRWTVQADTLDLHADAGRQLTELDHDGHLMLISCGAALHHARVALRATGWQVEVDRPATEPLARIRLVGHGAADPAAAALARAAESRHTDRRPVAAEPAPPEAVDAVVAAMHAERIDVHILHREHVVELAAAVDKALYAEGTDERQRAELAEWVGGARPGGTGVPDTAIPDAAPQTTVPGRDFGVLGSLPPGSGHDEAAVYAVLYGTGDTAPDWLRAGEALSAGWLEAVNHGLSLLPISAPVEIASTRHLLRRLVSGIGYPYLVVRLGTAIADAGTQTTPRLPSSQTIEVRDH
jgi:nitroreductase